MVNTDMATGALDIVAPIFVVHDRLCGGGTGEGWSMSRCDTLAIVSSPTRFLRIADAFAHEAPVWAATSDALAIRKPERTYVQ